ncbi:MAG TPA: sensor histidine kinase [Ramlibacter sp.]|uniref:sensor histidine kinase n=1 Tax=Ramlibacter sp. TaxID=1917967 RepID=UPI002C39E48D|nr:sensor histidine kinase [Ramlibacter sp.]HVZ43705.1 sensor histidine kinase [Ramlibacter sp.]
MSRPPGASPSLRTRILRHTLFALALVWFIGSVVTLFVAQYFTQEAFDRSLLDDAYLLESNVKADGRGNLKLELTPGEIKAVLFDQQERVIFSVRTPDGRLIAGQTELDLRPEAAGAATFRSVSIGAYTYRAVVRKHATPPFIIIVAHTTIAREEMLERLVVLSLAPQLALLLALALWVRRSTGADLEPLAELGRLVQRRSASDLQPLVLHGGTSDVERLTEAINALLLRLEQAVREQREFTGNVAHELRTPLAGIRAMAEYGLKQADPAQWLEQLRGIAANEARASRLLDRLLELALAYEAEMNLKLAPVPLDQLVREAVLRFLPRADKGGVDLGAQGLDTPVTVQGDATLIEGIINNLVDNALRYGQPAGGETPSITVALDRRGADVVLSVLDNGPGLPADQQANLVDRGVQGEPGQLLGEGAGIGLALVSQYARLLGARMVLASGPDGRGWRCEIVFPAQAG